MAGTVVHMAFAGLLAAAFLGAAYDRRAVLVVLGVTALPDIDSFLALVSTGAHRALLHNFVVPVAAAVLLWIETTRRERSAIRSRYGPRGIRVAWVAISAYAVAGVGLDMVAGGVNPLYPLFDQFFVLDGKIELSNQRGIIQTFVDLGADAAGDGGSGGTIGSTETVSYSTGVDPDPDGSETDPERIFPVVRTGWQLLVLVVGSVGTLAKFYVPDDVE
jgi:hypothetical protein